jgi:hypothetical protein
MNSRVPVAIEWINPAGEKLVERAFTRIVGSYGCLLVLPHELGIDQLIQVTNSATGEAITGVVVSKGNRGADGWELGIELLQPPMDFWGLDL